MAGILRRFVTRLFTRREIFTLSAGMVAGFISAGTAMAQDRPVIVTDTYPLAYFAQALGGPDVDVLFLVPPEVDPSFWRPAISEIATIQSADVIALNGAGFSTWPTRASLPRSRVVDTSAGFAQRLIQTDVITHSHGDAGEHSHEGTASYTWLDFSLAAEQAEALAGAMVRQRPELAAQIDARRADLLAELAALDARAAQVAAQIAERGAPVITSHPRYQYFGAAYGLEIVALEWDAHEVPDAAQWAQLDALVAQTGAQLFLWEAAPNQDARDRMAAMGLTDVVFAPLANRPATGRFSPLMSDTLDALEEAANRLETPSHDQSGHDQNYSVSR